MTSSSPATLARALDIDAALNATRRQLLLDALQNEPLELGQLLAETGLRSEVALPLIEELVSADRITRIRTGDVERLDNPDSLSQQYARLRALPPGEERSGQLRQLIDRAGELARRGRFTRAKVQSLWNSGHDGSRIVALGVIQKRPDLGGVEMIVEGLRESRSAFETSQAFKAMLSIWPSLAKDGVEQIRLAAIAALDKGLITHAERDRLKAELSRAGVTPSVADDEAEGD